MLEKTKILTSVCLYHAINDGSVSVVPILFPIFKEMFNLSYFQVGTITSIGLLICLISELLIGKISDGKNSKNMLSLGIILIVISMFLLTQTTGFFLLLIFIMLLRFSSSFFHPVGIGWISRIFKTDRVDHAMGIQSGSADIGAFIAIVSTLYISEKTNWSIPLIIWAVAGIIVISIVIILTFNLPKEFFVSKNNKQGKTIKESYNESIDFLKRIKFVIPAFIISGSSFSVVMTYFPLLLNDKTSIPLTHIGIIIGIWIGMGAIASFMYGKISQILGRKNVIILCYLGIGLSGLLLSFILNIVVISFVMIVMGISIFISFPALFSSVSQTNIEGTEGGNFGVIFTLQLGGGTTVLFIGGILSDLIDIWIPFAIIGIMGSIYGMFLLISRKHNFVKLNS